MTLRVLATHQTMKTMTVQSVVSEPDDSQQGDNSTNTSVVRAAYLGLRARSGSLPPISATLALVSTTVATDECFYLH